MLKEKSISIYGGDDVYKDLVENNLNDVGELVE